MQEGYKVIDNPKQTTTTTNRGLISAPVLVEVVEGGAEFVELLLADALGVPSQDLVLHLVDGAVDGGEKLLPAHTQGFHGVLGVPG